MTLTERLYLLERISFTAGKNSELPTEGPDRGGYRDLLLNHLNRLTEKDLEGGFLEHVQVIRHTSAGYGAECMPWMATTS